MQSFAACLALALTLPCIAGAESDVPDWGTVAEVETVQVITQNEDGRVRDTKVWLAVMDDRGYIRTGNSSWGENVLRDPEVEVRIDGTAYALRVHFVEDDGLRFHFLCSF